MQLWITADIRPERGLERVELREGDLYVESWSYAGTLHQVTVRATDILAIDARDVGAWPVDDPNQTVASWLLHTMIEEETDSGPTSPQSFSFDPN